MTKHIKEEYYKGYKIIIRGEFKESTTVFKASNVYYDSVNLGMYVKDKFGRELHQEFKTIETLREERNKMFKEVNENVGKLYKNAKEIIDKKVREKEMTNGLPESLLINTNTEEEKEEPTGENAEDMLLNFIYMAMMDLGYTLEDIKKGEPIGSKADEFAKKIAEKLKRHKEII